MASQLQVDTITNAAGSGAPNFTQGFTVGGNETLSVYNENATLTPVLTPTTSGSYTHTKQKAEMIQVGKMVMLSVDINTSGSSSPVGNASIVISGAPRADVTGISVWVGDISYDGISITNENVVAGADDSNSVMTIFLYKCAFGGGSTATKITVGEVNASVFKARLTITYKAQ